MTQYIRCRASQLAGLIGRRISKLQDRVESAVDKTIQAAVPIIKSRAPKAFGDLQGSVHAVEGKVVVDAPHAGAVEIGSPPHKPDMERLVDWVKLRGLQGLRGGHSNRLHGPTTHAQAETVKALLAKAVQTGVGGRFSPVDAPQQVAEAIAKQIELHGTKPHWFVRDSLSGIQQDLNQRVRRAMRK